MNKTSKSTLGVTLLEILLVLAVAAMIIIMSIRYYQSANTNNQANAALQTIQAITSAADQLASVTGTYSNVTSANIANLLPTERATAWGGGDVTITSAGTAGSQSYTVSVPNVPPGVCTILKAQLQNLGGNYGPLTNCSATGPATATYTYTSNPGQGSGGK